MNRHWNAAKINPIPWKNGGGLTREFLKLPHPDYPDRFLFRLSIATVSQGGPFSVFPGIDRHLTLLEGQGMRLKFKDGSVITLDKSFASAEFSGEELIDCELIDGSNVDFNVMVDRQWGKARVEILTFPAGDKQLVSGTLTYVYEPNLQRLTEINESECEFTHEFPFTLLVIRYLPTDERFHL